MRWPMITTYVSRLGYDYLCAEAPNGLQDRKVLYQPKITESYENKES